MSATSVRTALQSRAPSISAPIYWPSDKIVPPEPPSPYIWANIEGLGSDLLGSGTRPLSSRPGFIRFNILIPYGYQIQEAYAIADTLDGIYSALTNAGGCQGLQTKAATLPEDGAQSTDGLWYGCSISVPFMYWAAAGA